MLQQSTTFCGMTVKSSTPEPLRFPRGVRFPRADEILRTWPPDSLERIASAYITTGYVVGSGKPGKYAAYIEANVHADRVWEMVRALVLALLPEVAAPIVGVKDEKPVFGRYTTRDAAIAVFEPYVDSLQHDGFLEFGVMFQQSGKTEEVFVPSAKYLRVWTSKAKVARGVLESHGVPEVAKLEFIDEYPRVSETLPQPNGNAGWPPVFEGLRKAFDELPAPGDAALGV